MPTDTISFHSLGSSEFWQTEGAMKLLARMIDRYNNPTRRTQYFTHLVERPNTTPNEPNHDLILSHISNAEHAAMLAGTHAEAELQVWPFDFFTKKFRRRNLGKNLARSQSRIDLPHLSPAKLFESLNQPNPLQCFAGETFEPRPKESHRKRALRQP